jgi:phosphonate transport system substrate-binding protein
MSAKESAMGTIGRRSLPERSRRFPALAIAALGVMLACGRAPSRDAEAPRPAPAVTGPVFTIALLPERNVFEQKKRYQPLQEYLSAALGRPVVFKLLDNYQVIFTEILEHRVEGAFFGSMNGAIAQLKGAVEILARPVELSGVSTYTGYIFSKLDSGITGEPATWKGKRVALVNKVTSAGYLYPLALLRRSGYKGDAEAYFKQVTFTGSHDAAILTVFNGEADFGACKNTVYDEYVKFHPEVQRDLAVLAVSAQFPSNGLGVSPDLPADLKKRLREALLGMNAAEDGQRALRQFKAQRFVETSKSDYQPVFDMAREAGIDLAGWPLRDIH